MQVILHTGVHCTDEDRLLKGLLRNADTWREEGVAVPGPGRYRKLLTEAMSALGDSRPAPEAREVLLDAILTDDPEHVKRLVLSHPNFFCVPRLAFDKGRLYRLAETRLQAFRAVFAEDRLRLFVGLRNPATFLPAVFGAAPHSEFDAFLNGSDPMQLRWSDFIRRLQGALPGVPITVWANEDTPFIWGEILRAMGGVPMTRKISGAFDRLSSILSAEGMQRFRAFLHENPTMTESQRRKTMAVMLERFALDEEIEQELDLPGWDGAYVDMLTELYEDDLLTIEAMEGVRMITP